MPGPRPNGSAGPRAAGRAWLGGRSGSRWWRSFLALEHRPLRDPRELDVVAVAHRKAWVRPGFVGGRRIVEGGDQAAEPVAGSLGQGRGILRQRQDLAGHGAAAEPPMLEPG